MECFPGKLSRRTFGRVILASLCAAALAAPILAQEATVRLTVIGRDGTQTLFTDADLDRLDPKTIDTTTYWTDGVQHFEGVLLRDVLAVAGIDPTLADARLEAVAHNDFTVVIPLADAVEWDVILARRMNGKALTLRDKGPLWIVYPRDQHEALRVGDYNHRWVWQLRQLKLL